MRNTKLHKQGKDSSRINSMKLGVTITSERGKAVTKTGNEYIIIQMNTDNKSCYDIYLDNEKITVFDVVEQKEILRIENGNLKHGKRPQYLNTDTGEIEYDEDR